MRVILHPRREGDRQEGSSQDRAPDQSHTHHGILYIRRERNSTLAGRYLLIYSADVRRFNLKERDTSSRSDFTLLYQFQDEDETTLIMYIDSVVLA
jgi:hypothetical protein